MISKLNDFVAQKIVEFIHEKSGFAVIVCDETGQSSLIRPEQE